MSGTDNAIAATGLFDGINNAVAIMRDTEDREKRIQREDTLYDQKQTEYAQGQQDRTHAIERRGVTEERADTKYDRDEADRVRAQRGQEALNSFMVRGDLDGTNAFLDEYSPEGMKPNIVLRDGKYFSEGPDASGKMVSKPVEKRDIGKLLMRMGKQDVFGDYQKQLDAEASGEKLKGDRGHDIDKIDLQNKGKVDVANINANSRMAISRNKKAGTKAEGKIPEYSKQSAKLAANFYGGKFENGVFSFGEEGNDAKAAATATLTDMLYKSNPEKTRNINAQFREATMLVENASSEASKIAKSEEESGALEKAGMSVEDRTAQILQSIIDQSVTKFKPAKAPAIEKDNKGKAGEKKTDKTKQKKLTSKEYRQSLRSNPKLKNKTDAEIDARVKDMMNKYPERFVPESKQTSNRGAIDRSKPKDVAALNRDGYSKRRKQSKAVIA